MRSHIIRCWATEEHFLCTLERQIAPVWNHLVHVMSCVEGITLTAPKVQDWNTEWQSVKSGSDYERSFLHTDRERDKGDWAREREGGRGGQAVGTRCWIITTDIRTVFFSSVKWQGSFVQPGAMQRCVFESVCRGESKRGRERDVFVWDKKKKKKWCDCIYVNISMLLLIWGQSASDGPVCLCVCVREGEIMLI